MKEIKLLTPIKCKLCGVEPKIVGGYSSVHDDIGYRCECPTCHAWVGAAGVSTYDFGIRKPFPNEEQIHNIHTVCKNKAIRKWNKFME